MAGFALFLTPAELDLALKDIFVSSRGFKRWTFPDIRCSIMSNSTKRYSVNAAVPKSRTCGDPISPSRQTSIMRAMVPVIRRGSLWKAVRASGSIPAILPPMFTDDGRMLVDGGVVDNIPLAPMKALKSGPNLVVHFGAPPAQPYTVKYENIPGRRQLLCQMLNPFSRATTGCAKPHYHPPTLLWYSPESRSTSNRAP